MFASIISKDQMFQYPFITSHLYLWEIVTSGITALFLVFERNNERIEGKFLPNVFKRAIPAAILLISSVCIIFLLFILQNNGLANFGIYNKECAVAMSIIAFSVLGTVFLYKVCSPLNKYRRIVLICSASVNTIALLITAIISLSMNIVEPVLQIPYIEMDGVSLITTLIIIVALAAIYLSAYQIVTIVKKEDFENEN